MAKTQTLIIAEIDPARPVVEACSVIDAIVRHNPAVHESDILTGIKEAIDKRLSQMKGAETNDKPVRGNNGQQKDQ